jgi:hypothetical protein
MRIFTQIEHLVVGVTMRREESELTQRAYEPRRAAWRKTIQGNRID